MRKLLILLFFCLPIKSATINTAEYIEIPKQKDLIDKIDELNFKLEGLEYRIKRIKQISNEIP